VGNVPFLEHEFGGFRLQGFSIGGLQTSWRLPALKALFDIGAHPFEFHNSNHLFLSHRHLDHTQGIIPLASTRRLQNQASLKIYGMPVVLDAVKNLLEGARLTGSGLCDVEWLALEAGNSVGLGAEYQVRPIPTFHSVPSCGYLVEKKIKSLKTEYAGLEGKELGALRKSGETIEDFASRPEVFFTLDTSIEVFEKNLFLMDVPVVVSECTFYCEATKSKAKELEHIHVQDLARLFKGQFRGSTLVLSHHSPRYSAGELEALVNQHFAGAPFEVVLWV
jgi:ribonuclease Z